MVQTIRGLTAASSFPRTSVIPTAPTSGSDVKTSGQQIVDMVQKGSVATHNTSVLLTGSEIVGGIIRSTPAGTGVTLTLPSALSIYSAIGSSPAVGTYVDCIFENLSNFEINLTKSDTDLLITGLVTTNISAAQSFSLRFSVTNLSPIQITVDGGTELTITNNITNQIVVSKAGNNTTGDGSLIYPYLTVSNALTNGIIGTSTILITPGAYSEGTTLTLRPAIEMVGMGDQISSVSATNIVLNTTEWDATSNPHLDIYSLSCSGNISLIPTNFKIGSAFRIKNSIIPSNATIGKIENVILENCTIGNNLTLQDIGTCVLSGSPNSMAGTLNILEVVSTGGTAPVYYIDGLNISTLNFNNTVVVDTISVYVTNCPSLSNGGTLNTNDVSGAGGVLFIYFDAISYPTTINNVADATGIGIIPSTFQSDFLLSQTFKTKNSLAFLSTPTSYNSNSGSTVTAGSLINGVITVNPSATQTITFDTAANIVSNYQSRFNTISDGDSFEVVYNNVSAFSSTITAGTHTSFAVSGATNVVQANTAVTFRFTRSGISFDIYGGLPVLALDSSVVHNTGNENISGLKSFLSPIILFQVQNSLVSGSIATNLTATSATISATQLDGNILTLNPTNTATYTLPDAKDIDAAIGTISVNGGITVTMVNQSIFLVTLSAGANTNLNGCYLTAAVVSIPANSARTFRVVKIDATPTYSLFG